MDKSVFINVENPESKADIGLLSDEMTFRRYMSGVMNTRKVFRKMSTGNYITIEIIERLIKKEYGDHANLDGSNRIYLKNLAEHFKMPMYKVSEIVRDMSERGMVIWTHDGKGEEETYITITESGKRTAEEQQEILKEFYTRVISSYGRERFVELLEMMADLDQTMESEMEKMEAEESPN